MEAGCVWKRSSFHPQLVVWIRSLHGLWLDIDPTSCLSRPLTRWRCSEVTIPRRMWCNCLPTLKACVGELILLTFSIGAVCDLHAPPIMERGGTATAFYFGHANFAWGVSSNCWKKKTVGNVVMMSVWPLQPSGAFWTPRSWQTEWRGWGGPRD